MKDDMLYHTQINTCMPEEQFDKKNPQNYEKVLIKMKEQKQNNPIIYFKEAMSVKY